MEAENASLPQFSIRPEFKFQELVSELSLVADVISKIKILGS